MIFNSQKKLDKSTIAYTFTDFSYFGKHRLLALSKEE